VVITMRLFTKRLGCIAVIPFMVAGVATASDVASPEPSADYSKPHYIRRAFGPKSWVQTGAGAAIGQANNTPHEWGQGAVGFGRRFASAFGKHIIHNTIQYPIARLRHEEFGYHPSGKTGFGPRLKYALAGTVITHKTTTGKRTLAVGEISGAVGSGLISRLWQPASTGSLAAGFASAGITLGVDAGLNVVKEFWPEIRHPHRHSEARSTASTAAVEPALNQAAEVDSSVDSPEAGE
jgi:hypothetical protein